MKSIFLKLFTSASLKTGIAYAAQIASLVVSVLQGVMAGDGLSDERRKQLASVLRGVIALRDFLNRLAELVGAPALQNINQLDDGWIVEKSLVLDRITDGL